MTLQRQYGGIPCTLHPVSPLAVSNVVIDNITARKLTLVQNVYVSSKPIYYMCDSWGQYCNQEIILLNIVFPCIRKISCIFLLLCRPCNFLLDAKQIDILSCWVLVGCCLEFSWALFQGTVRLPENSLILWVCSEALFGWTREPVEGGCLSSAYPTQWLTAVLACVSPSDYASAPDSGSVWHSLCFRPLWSSPWKPLEAPSLGNCQLLPLIPERPAASMGWGGMGCVCVWLSRLFQ